MTRHEIKFGAVHHGVPTGAEPPRFRNSELRLCGRTRVVGIAAMSAVMAAFGTGCGYTSAPSEELAKVTAQTMRSWRGGDYSEIYDSLSPMQKGILPRIAWEESMKLRDQELGRPVSYRIIGVESLDPTVMGLRLFRARAWGVKMSITSDKGRRRTELGYVYDGGRLLFVGVNDNYNMP